MLFAIGFHVVDPKCSSYQAKDLICFSGDCHEWSIQLRLQEKTIPRSLRLESCLIGFPLTV